MLILKRLTMFLAETLSAAVLIGVFLLVLSGRSRGSTVAEDLLLGIVGTVIVFMIGSGYLFTTAVFGVIWRSRKSFLYPLIGLGLFIAHVQFFVTGWDLPFKLKVQTGGGCIVFVCSYLGSWLLRQWIDKAGPAESN